MPDKQQPDPSYGKLVGGGMSSGFGGAIAVVVVALWWPHADPTVAAALTTIFSTLTGLAGTYLAPHNMSP